MMPAPLYDQQSLVRSPSQRIRIIFWTVGLLIAAYQCVLYNQWINGDSISYLDMSDGVASGDFGRLVNATWSPLYPLLLGIANAIVHPSAAREFAVAHGVNFVCFVLAFAAFEFLLASAASPLNLPSREPHGAGPSWALPVIGYSLFLWASLGMLTLMKLTPDMLMMALLFAGVGLLLRIRNGATRWQMYALLGVVLAVGYLAKAIMFPLGVVMLGMTLFFSGAFIRKLKGALIAGVCFAAVAGPYVVGVSRLAHRLTIGEAGTIVHMVYVERNVPYFQGKGGGTGTFVHPVNVLVEGAPPVFSFVRPIHATYALWFDPYYWSEGVRPSFHLRRQAGLLLGNLRVYVGIVGELAGLILAILYMAYRVGLRSSIQSLRGAWPWCVVSLAALAAYALVHVETRYVGAFVLLLSMGLIYNLWVPSRVSNGALTAIALVIVLNLSVDTLVHMYRDRSSEAPKRKLHDASAAVALQELDVAPGDPVGDIEPLVASGWARLARVEIVAEVPRPRALDYWKSTPQHQAAVIAAFASAGCKVVVGWVGKGAIPAGWERLGDSQYAVHRLP